MADDLDVRWQRLAERLARRDPANEDEVVRLALAVAAVPDRAMTDDECRSWLPSYLDAEIGGLDAAALYPAVKRHLDLSPALGAEYVALLELALAADRAELPQPVSRPQPRLSFLPPSLAEYVGDLAQRVVAAIAPKRSADLRAVAGVFFRRIAEQGGQVTLRQGFAPALGFGGGDPPLALKLLAATYATTQSLTQSYSRADIESQIAAGQWRQTARATAAQTARDLGLGARDADRFADSYATLVASDPTTLQALARRAPA